MSEAQEEGAAVVTNGNVQITQDMPNGRKMAITVWLYESEDVASINARIDDYMAIMERTRVRLEIPLLEKALETDKVGLANQLEAMTALAERQSQFERGDKAQKLTTSEKTHMQQTYPTTIRHLKDKIARGEVEIEKLRTQAM